MKFYWYVLKTMNIHDHNSMNKLDFHAVPLSLIVREHNKKMYCVKLWNNLPAFLKDKQLKFVSIKVKVHLLLQ